MKPTSPKKKSPVKAEVKDNEILLMQIIAEQNLRKTIEDSENRYNMMLMQSPFAFAVLKGKDMVVTVANDSIKQMWGKGNKVEGKPLVEILPEIKDQEFPALLHKVYTTGIPYLTNESIARVKRKGKMEDLYFNFSYQPFRENDGTISGIIIFAIEVTEQVIVKKALEAQNEKEKKALKLVEEINNRYYTMLMESPFAFSVMKGKDMVVTLANDLMKEFWGKGNEVEGKTILQVLPELKNQPFPAMLDKVYTTGIPVYANEILAELQYKDKMQERHFNIVYQPDLEVDGTISGVITIAYEVTEMVLARKKIEDSDKRFRTLVEQAPVAMCVVRGDKFVFEVANEKHLQLIGKTKEQIMNLPVFTALPEAADQGYEALLGGVYETGIPFTASESPLTVIRNGKEETIYVNFVFEPLYDSEHKIDGVFSVASDVTEQVVSRKKVEESEKRYKMMLMQSPFAFAVLKGKDMVVTIANDSIKQIWGKGNEIEGKPLLEVLPELKGQEFPALLHKVYTTGIPYLANESFAQMKHKGKMEDLYFNFVYQPYYETDDTISGVTIIAIEVTKQVLARKKIEESEQRFRLALAGSTQIIFSQDKNLKHTWIYNSHPDFKPEDIVGKSDNELHVPATARILTDIKQKILNTGKAYNGEVEIELGGQVVNYAMHIETIKDAEENVTGIIGTVTDITERIKTQKKIKESEKQQAYLLNLSDALRQLHNPVDIEEAVTKFTRDFMDTDRCFYANIEDDNAIILRDSMRGNLPSNAGVYPLSSFTLLKAALDTGSPYVVDDVNTSNIIDEDLKQLCLKLQNNSFINIPVIKNRKPVGIFCFVQNKPRKWTESEVQLTIETAERTWAAIERAKAEEALRKSEEKYRTLFTSIDQGYALCELVRNKEGKGNDYYILEVNPTYEKQSGVSMEMVHGKTILQAFPTVDKQHIDTYAAVVDNQCPVVFEQYFEVNHRWHELKVYPGEKDRFTVLFSNITERKRKEANLTFLAGINFDFAPLLTPTEVMNHIAEKLANHLHLSRCHFSIVDEEQDRIEVIDEYRVDEKLPSVMGVHHISELVTEEARKLYKAGKLVAMNTTVDSPLLKVPAQMLKEMGIGSLVDVPHHEVGKWKFVLTITRAEVCEWRSDEIELLQELTSRIYIRLDRAKAEEALRKSEERLRLATQASDIYWWEFDFETNATIYSPNTEQVIGAPPAKTFEENLLFLHPDDRELQVQAFGKAIKNDTNYFSYLVRSIAVPSDIRWLEVSGKIIRDNQNKPTLAVGISQNITERKQFENELMEAKVFAETAVKFKQQFLSNMSHEIRTPLNSILGFANVLLKTELGAEQKEFLQAIKTSGYSLNLLINDILDLAKVDAGKMVFIKQPFEISPSLKSILYSFDLKIKEKNIELIKEYDSKIPSILLGDSVRLNQIILNLISNAVKFTHKGKIILSVKLLHEDEENVNIEFAVSDTGIGIAANKLNSIFNLFEQAELSTSNSYGGTGLGLAIVKQLIEEQGGSISLKSKLGEGSTFTFILPFGKTNIKSEEEIEIPTLNSKIKTLRVLVAEDVALNQLLIKIILNDFGFEHEIVGNGKLAIEKMQTNTYDIILMDLQMPEMNGFEATEYIRKTLKSQIPIIALTADVTTADVSKCKEFGMDSYISKPINEDLLYSKIVELVKRNDNYG